MDISTNTLLATAPMQTPDHARHQGGTSFTSSKTTSLNDRLNTNFVNVATDDTSVDARVTRAITSFVGNFVTPRFLLVLLRILKAITFCFLILTLAANLMYIVFLEVAAVKQVKEMAGGRRDMIIRIYGLALIGVAICIELDYAAVVKSFYGFKGFIPRGLLLFFISAITGAHPLHVSNNNGQAFAMDDDDSFYAESDIPQSAIVFQMVTSFIIGLCAIAYFVFGCLCLDRFTSRAFLSTNDPLVSTAIPRPSAVEGVNLDRSGAYHSPRDP